jgi:glutamine phosphoribosylpyrophosphate amidotransferase
MRSRKEFLARDEEGNIKAWNQICQKINADSLAYVENTDLEKVIGFPVCKGCVDFPDGYPKDLKNDVLELSKRDEVGKRAYEQ